MVIPNYSCHSLEIHNQCRTNQTSPNAGSLAQTLIQTRFPSWTHVSFVTTYSRWKFFANTDFLMHQ